MCATSWTATVMALGVVLAANAARADGECVNGFRDTTAAERQTIIAVREATKAALPPAPEGWVIGGYEEISARQNICRDVEGTPWPYAHTRIFNRADDIAEREQFSADAGAALRAQAEERQPRIDALMARMQTLGTELADAAQRGDQARVDALNEETQKIQLEFDHIFNDSPSEAQLEAIGAATMQDRVMEIAVAINSGSVSTGDMSSGSAPPGARAAYRSEIVHEGVTNTQVLVLLGNWQPGDGGMRSVPRDAVSAAAAHTMAVTVTADPSRIDALLASIDFGALVGLLR